MFTNTCFFLFHVWGSAGFCFLILKVLAVATQYREGIREGINGIQQDWEGTASLCYVLLFYVLLTTPLLILNQNKAKFLLL